MFRKIDLVFNGFYLNQHTGISNIGLPYLSFSRGGLLSTGLRGLGGFAKDSTLPEAVAAKALFFTVKASVLIVLLL